MRFDGSLEVAASYSCYIVLQLCNVKSSVTGSTAAMGRPLCAWYRPRAAASLTLPTAESQGCIPPCGVAAALQTYAPGGANPLLPAAQVPSTAAEQRCNRLCLTNSLLNRQHSWCLLLLCRHTRQVAPTPCCQLHKSPAAASSSALDFPSIPATDRAHLCRCSCDHRAELATLLTSVAGN
jgi:hypothetical protein